MSTVYTVQFPKLGLKFEVNPTAFTVGDFFIQWYGVIIAVGVLLAFLYAMKSCKKFRIDQDRLIDTILVGLVGGIIGARLYYVLFYPGNDYLADPSKIFRIRDGGLAIYGGIIGGALCGALMAKIRKLKIPVVLDIASLGFLIGQCIGRWGNYVNQEAFGSETSLPWGMVSERTQAVTSQPVHPCFLYESLWCLLGFVLLHIFSRKFRRYDGQTFLVYLIWYGVGRFFIEGLRTDSLITPGVDLRVSQVVALVTILASAVLLVVFRKRTSLSGCGLKRIMELNGIHEEEKEEAADDGVSTIFGDMKVDLDETDSLAEEEKPEAEGEAPTQEEPAETEKTEGAEEKAPEETDDDADKAE